MKRELKLRLKLTRLFKPRILKRMDVSGTRNPRRSNLEADNTVYAFRGNTNSLIREQLANKKDHLFKGFNPSDHILIKINLNTADPYSASTDPETLLQLLNLMEDMGYRNLIVGDCSSAAALPTQKVFEKTGLANLVKHKARMVCFDEQEWVGVPIPGEFLNKIVVPKLLFEVDKIIYLANLKAHRLADFSMGLKLAVGLVHPLQRYTLHDQFLQEKVAETALAVTPDLVFLDAREPFITLGPEQGDTARGETIFAGHDLLSVDLEGYRLLYELKRQANCTGNFTADPFEMRQFKHAAKILRDGKEA